MAKRRERRSPSPGAFRAPSSGGAGANEIAQLLMALTQSRGGKVKFPSNPATHGGGGGSHGAGELISKLIQDKKREDKDKEREETRKRERGEDKETRANEIASNQVFQRGERREAERTAREVAKQRKRDNYNLEKVKLSMQQRMGAAKFQLELKTQDLTRAKDAVAAFEEGSYQVPLDMDPEDYAALIYGNLDRAYQERSDALLINMTDMIDEDAAMGLAPETWQALKEESGGDSYYGRIATNAALTHMISESSRHDKSLREGHIAEAEWRQIMAQKAKQAAMGSRTAELTVNSPLRKGYELFGMDTKHLFDKDGKPLEGPGLISASGEGFSLSKGRGGDYIDSFVTSSEQDRSGYKSSPNKRIGMSADLTPLYRSTDRNRVRDSLASQPTPTQLMGDKEGSKNLWGEYLAHSFPQENHPARALDPSKLPNTTKWVATAWGRSAVEHFQQKIDEVQGNNDMDKGAKARLLGQLREGKKQGREYLEKVHVSQDDIMGVAGGAYMKVIYDDLVRQHESGLFGTEMANNMAETMNLASSIQNAEFGVRSNPSAYSGVETVTPGGLPGEYRTYTDAMAQQLSGDLMNAMQGERGLSKEKYGELTDFFPRKMQGDLRLYLEGMNKAQAQSRQSAIQNFQQMSQDRRNRQSLFDQGKNQGIREGGKGVFNAINQSMQQGPPGQTKQGGKPSSVGLLPSRFGQTPASGGSPSVPGATGSFGVTGGGGSPSGTGGATPGGGGGGGIGSGGTGGAPPAL